MYLRIFKKTTPLSKYLQGHGVNIIAAYQMVKQTLNDLQDCARQLQYILNKIDSEDIIKKLGARSPVFGRMLLC
ncbi:unnamed protein product [Macrosiphum euphorbiae]|uniref:Uncharacterized protein n=1 Tax=Macrosiphum euphorbiae TaxID=13131 RepID=A0AAV0XXD5_9HEMI|nr:unnamed protein product [Macrosiphum euphorbiae]